eukprot:8894240-Lingulodinium_polyedra.AAC.1
MRDGGFDARGDIETWYQHALMPAAVGAAQALPFAVGRGVFHLPQGGTTHGCQGQRARGQAFPPQSASARPRA